MKVLYLKGIYSIKNINVLSASLKEESYDFVDYSGSSLDEYTKIFLDSYNSDIKIPEYSYNTSESFFDQIYFFIASLGFCRIFFKKFKFNFQKKYFYNNLLSDLYIMGYETFFIIALLSFFLGVNFGYQSYIQLAEYGLVDNGMSFIVLSSFKQSGVLVSCTILSAKYSSSLISQVGFMRVSEEWTALKLMKVDPEIFIFKSKIFSLIILTPFFAYISIFFTCLGSFFVFKLFCGINLLFVLSTASVDNLKHLITPLIKGIIIGAGIGLVSAYESSLIKNSSDNIIKGLNHGVVMSLVVAFLLNITLDLIFGF
ncbi:ABC transporter permease [Alphaproteobacteria bacterium endosymbiont of Tiliacea citrago]|uniref:ABC transporter permease n=1 Tax=Alphaproteobacteria bacterium endosymbiont of Tiliacea citrago TaxID=3077944 RepID=UPI00313EF8F6